MLRRLIPWTVAAVLLTLIAVACTGGKSGNGGSPTATSTTMPTTQASPQTSPGPQPTVIPGSPTPPPGPILRFPVEEVPATGEVLAVPGFEDCPPDGQTPCFPWYSLKAPDFELSDVAHSGNTAAYLKMREPNDAQGVKVFYLVQEVKPTEFPEVLSGYYRVDNWKRGTQKQYMQFVVIVVGADNAPQGFSNHQIRYLLAGIDQEPFEISNAKFVFLSKVDPKQGEWVRFKVNVKQDFIDLWGEAPVNFDFIRLLYEVRYDDKIAGSGTPEADVYYDDLHFGPADGAP